MKRKLTTIFCADVSGYSRMMGADEARTLATLKEYREAIEGFIARHHGRVVSWSGDGLLAEFASVVEAVQCAAEVQRELRARNGGREEDQRMSFRIGINLGDVMADGDDIFGEGVNIAARLQQMAAAGGILVSSSVYEQVRGKLSMSFASLGTQAVKNIAGEVSVYSVNMEGVTPQKAVSAQKPGWGESAPQPEAPRQRRGKLFRRGLALILDYGIVAAACFGGALALNTVIGANTIRMDLDMPFVDYHGDRVASTAWAETKTEVDDGVNIVHEQRIVTYDYFGLFQQTYKQQRTRGYARFTEKKRGPGGEPGAGDSAGDPPAGATPPAGSPAPAGGAPAADPPDTPDKPDAPDAPSAPPAPPAPPRAPEPPVHLPGVSVDGDQVTIGNGAVVIGPNGVKVDPEAIDSDGTGLSITVKQDRDEGWGLSFSHVDETLLDPATGTPITRPSLDVLTLILLALYFAIMEAGRHASTIGKRAFDLIVTRVDGRPASFATTLGRNVIKVLSTFIFPIAIIVALFSKRRQGIHDHIAGTVVVRVD